ncbi:hypothetical protein [Aurantibacillus circumpalustris]|uniref:hypothetical protein n=1 Tax=Aurantibacillus circumpalustris TaxID=3036359 RepID=UPI00295B224D|nr:hypothetical protein [Aurantibacillus circumpalustris]
MNRVWTYIISAPLGDVELDQLLKAGTTFVEHWSAHENKLTATFEIFKKRIVVVKVDEDITGASGCSIDKLTRFIKVSETMFGVELFNRLLIAYKNGEEVEIVHSSKIKELLDQKVISENSIVYNTSVGNRAELEVWEQPLKNTWLNKYLN